MVKKYFSVKYFNNYFGRNVKENITWIDLFLLMTILYEGLQKIFFNIH